MARVVLGPDMNIQAPPNLSPGELPQLIAAGLNDWGGVSPVTPDHVNPEAPWPAIDRLARAETAAAGKCLAERLADLSAPISRNRSGGLTRRCIRLCCASCDAEGFAREDDWAPGTACKPHRGLSCRVRRGLRRVRSMRRIVAGGGWAAAR